MVAARARRKPWPPPSAPCRSPRQSFVCGSDSLPFPEVLTPASPQYRTAQTSKIAERRLQVARLRLAGVHDTGLLAREIGVSARTIRDDVVAIEAQWRQETAREMDADRAFHLARAEAVIHGLWSAARDGDQQARALLLRYMDYEARLLGLYASKREIDDRVVELERTTWASRTGLPLDTVP